MDAWWQGLTLLNKGFAVAAVFFSVLFVWQFLGALLGLHGDSDGGGGHDHGDDLEPLQAEGHPGLSHHAAAPSEVVRRRAAARWPRTTSSRRSASR